MEFLSLEPFVPSGSDFVGSKQLFQEIGFHINWDAGDFVGFQKDACRFILQRYDSPQFAQNFMLSVKVDDINAFSQMLIEKDLSKKFAICIGQIKQESYGKELNIIDLAGVCWHFVEQ